MTLQLFSFGHPCEHQLRRACIGGSSCPLNGYPDTWCCSYIKGKINFKRDKPCEGARCRWGFTHPTQQQFDTVTQVLNESRPIGAKIDEAAEDDLLSFHIDSPHIVDTVQCALHMMRHPPISCARSVGQLMAYAAVKAGDPKVFMLMLKTMKKPVDNYLLGAYMFLTQGNPPTPNQATTTTKGKKDKTAKKEDVVEELKNDLVDIMNAALSHGGHLVDREDQHTLQATLIQALRSYPKSNKKRADMLEAALALFGDRQMPKNPPPMAKDSGMSTPSHTSTTPSAVKAAAKPVEPTAAAAAVEEVPEPAPPKAVAQGISRVVQEKPPGPPPATYTPIATEQPLPDVYLFGGLFALNPRSASNAVLGPATTMRLPEISRSTDSAADAFHMVSTGNNLFADNFFNNLSGEGGFDTINIDTAQLFKDLEGWGN